MSVTQPTDKQMGQIAADVAIAGFDKYNAIPFTMGLNMYDKEQQHAIMNATMAMQNMRYISDTQKKITFCWLYLNLVRCRINGINEFKYDPKIMLTKDEDLPSWEFIQKCLANELCY